MAEFMLALFGALLQFLQVQAVFLGLALQVLALYFERRDKKAPRSSQEDEPRP